MNRLQMQSKSLVDENIEKISSLFPNCVSEGLDESGKLIKVVDFDLLKQELSDVVVEGNEERYVLNWAGKKASMLAANAPIAKTLRPVLKESVGKDGSSEKFDSENLYIEGDNLDVLKLLRETYLGKIKMIYIDPPYNTGKDFVYKDDFSMSAEEYFEKSNQIDDQGNRLFTNNDSNGRFHSDWLSMMYSRLKLAKDLLTDDGAIFISIDDNEYVNLKKVLEEIFGESNFIGEIVRKTKSMTGDSGVGFNLQHESLIFFAKNINEVYLKGESKSFDSYYNKDNDPNGDWTSADPSAKSGGKTTYFEIKNPYTNKVDLPPKGRYWAFSQQTLKDYIQHGRIVFKKEHGENERGFIFKRYKKDLSSKHNPISSLFIENKYMNQSATIELNKLFNEAVFSYPKPVDFLKDIIRSLAENDELILDFFSGSATTAHAVMQLNAEDGGNRRHIMVQLPEKTDEKSEAFKAGYKTIPEIAKERIRRAGKKILEDNKNSKEPKNLSNLDIGFRVLKLDDSNMKDVYYSPSELKQETIFDIQENIKEDRTEEDLLFQVMLDMGVLLSSEIKTLDFDGKKVFNVNNGNLVCCFDKNISESVVTQIAQMKPLYAVFRDSSISSDSMSANFDQIFETYSSTTIRKIL